MVLDVQARFAFHRMRLSEIVHAATLMSLDPTGLVPVVKEVERGWPPPSAQRQPPPARGRWAASHCVVSVTDHEDMPPRRPCPRPTVRSPVGTGCSSRTPDGMPDGPNLFMDFALRPCTV